MHRFSFALCPRAGDVILALSQDTRRNSIKTNSDEASGTRVVVQRRSLGEFLENELPRRRIDLIKMDIDGAEIGSHE